MAIWLAVLGTEHAPRSPFRPMASWVISHVASWRASTTTSREHSSSSGTRPPIVPSRTPPRRPRTSFTSSTSAFACCRHGTPWCEARCSPKRHRTRCSLPATSRLVDQALRSRRRHEPTIVAFLACRAIQSSEKITRADQRGYARSPVTGLPECLRPTPVRPSATQSSRCQASSRGVNGARITRIR